MQSDPQYLLEKVAASDQYGFLNTSGNWDNHRPLLLLALSLTDHDVYELGSGDGSTPHLRQYCDNNNRRFYSFDNNKDWCDKTGAYHVDDWGSVLRLIQDRVTKIGVIFIDHAPGERRVEDAIRLANDAQILVMHDTEEGGAGDYKWDKAWPHFKYRLNFNKDGGGAGATAVSNTIDLNRFRGLSLGPYTFDND